MCANAAGWPAATALKGRTQAAAPLPAAPDLHPTLAAVTLAIDTLALAKKPLPRHPMLAGLVDAFTVLALVLTLGLLAYAPMGAQAASLGIIAAFASVIAGSLVFALWSGAATPVAGPSSATALMLAALVATLARDPALDIGAADGVLAVVAVASIAVIGMGLLQLLMGLTGLGRLAQFVPQPVLAGFMNGVAVLILLGQLPTLLGLPPLTDLANAATLAQPLTLLVGLGTIGTVWAASRWWPRAPAPLLALALGSALYALLHASLPGQPLGPLVGPLPQGVVLPDALLPLRDGSVVALLQRHAGLVLSTAGLMALLSALESLLAAVAIDQLCHTHTSGRRLLLTLGGTNLVSGLFGGLPMVLSRTRALGLLDHGTIGRVPALASVAVFALMYAAGSPLLELLPRSVLAGIMVTIAVALVDRWTRQLLRQWHAGDRSPDLRQSLLLVAVVAAITLALGFVAGVVAGLMLSVLVFLRQVNRSLVRSRYSAAQRPSRRLHHPAVEAVLQPLRRHIQVLELEGALFFGSVSRLASEVEALGPEVRHLVIDLRRVSTLDESGAVLLQQLALRLPQRGIALWLAGVAVNNRHGRCLQAYGCFRGHRADLLSDVDHATETAELSLLAQTRQIAPQAVVTLADTSLLQGLSATQIDRLRPLLIEQRLAAGEWLFRQGDAADCLYLLTEGSITVRSGKDASAQRFASFSPGVMLGELALLDGGGRSADALADRAAQVFALSRDGLAAVSAIDPAVAQQLLRNIALHLAQRLRLSSAANRDDE